MENERIEFLQSVKVTKLCEKCGGDMAALDYIYPTYPAQYPHKCIKCGNEQNYDRSYPAIQYRAAGDGSGAV